MNNPYTVLGVSTDASPKDIKKAYKRLASKYHPDKNKDPSAVQQFQSIQEAYDTLSDPKKKAQFENPFSGNAENAYRHEWNFNDNFGSNKDFEEVLRKARANAEQSHANRTQINISLEQCFTGTTYKLDGRSFNVPKGIRPKAILRVYGYLVTVNILPHKKFKRAEDDLLLELTIDSTEAMVGIDAIIQTLDNKTFKVKIPAGTQPNQVIKLAKKGMQNPEIPSKIGDLLIKIQVTIPKDLTAAQQAAIMSLPHRTSISI